MIKKYLTILLSCLLLVGCIVEEDPVWENAHNDADFIRYETDVHLYGKFYHDVFLHKNALKWGVYEREYAVLCYTFPYGVTKCDDSVTYVKTLKAVASTKKKAVEMVEILENAEFYRGR